MERSIYIDNCVICGVSLLEAKNDLTTMTSSTQKPIFQMIGKNFKM
jgi:hypothetical protein